MLPVVKNGFDLTEQPFWDGIKLRYDSSVANVPATSASGSIFTIQHSMCWKAGGFINIGHNDVIDLTAKFLSEVCHDVQVEPS